MLLFEVVYYYYCEHYAKVGFSGIYDKIAGYRVGWTVVE